MVTLIVVLLILGSCGGGAPGSMAGHMDDHADAGSAGGFGRAASVVDADRTVEVSALDSLTFDPAHLTVEEGETVSFVVTNEGRLDHEFVLGDEEYQSSHAADMAGRMMHRDEPNAVSLAPGETKEIVWEFTDSGEVLFGCHVEDHYSAGMVGVIAVG